jgi:xanthine dehydrogenase accessory factor
VPSDLDILHRAAALSASGSPFVLITVIGAKGSTPRNAGAKMIWRPGEGGGPDGTVGGGQFEYLVLDAAQRHYERRTCGVERYVLGADADQCCGGVMEVFFEYVGARRRVVVFGAGHVGHALAHLLAPSGLEIVIADDRPAWNSPERFPSPRFRRVGAWEEAVDLARESPAATLACVMTCSHDRDFELLRMLLRPSGVGPPAFVGLIGSKSKRACLFGRLVASGVPEAEVQRVRCPLGVGDTGKEPPLVAISIAAQVLMEARNLASL